MQINKYFGSIEDPRIDRGKLHSLSDIFGLVIIAGLCGIKSWEDISFFGKIKEQELKEVLSFNNGVPSHDTLERVFSMIDPKAFGKCFMNWTQSICSLKQELIVLDGKVARNSILGKTNAEPLYLVNAWASKNRMVMAQFKTQGKGHELVGIKELLQMLCINGTTISIDALGCQKDVAEEIVQQQADYILAVKDNQAQLKDDIVSSFALQKAFDSVCIHEKNSGRVETRKCSVINNLKNISTANDWINIQSIIQVETSRYMNNVEQQQIRYYISSLKVSAKEFNALIRAHWGIENSLHWMLDVVFNEDKSRKRKGFMAENYALVNKTVLNILRNDKLYDLPVKRKQLLANHNFKYLKSLIKFDA